MEIFLSHATADASLSEAVSARLEALGVKVFMAEHDNRAGLGTHDQIKAFAGCSGHALVAAGGAIFERVRTADGTEHHIEVHRGQFKRERTSNGYTLYAQHRLDCTETGAAHTWWESLTPTRADAAAGFNRCEYLRVLPGHHPDYRRVYGMRQDTESLNAQLEYTFHKNRLPAWGVQRQLNVVTFACMAQNSWALHAWQREIDRQQAPPALAA